MLYSTANQVRVHVYHMDHTFKSVPSQHDLTLLNALLQTYQKFWYLPFVSSQAFCSVACGPCGSKSSFIAITWVSEQRNNAGWDLRYASSDTRRGIIIENIARHGIPAANYICASLDGKGLDDGEGC